MSHDRVSIKKIDKNSQNYKSIQKEIGKSLVR